jgi:DNA polymerase
MALAAQLSLPLSLEKLAEFFGLKKDMAGHKAMKKLSRPRRPSKDNDDEFWERDTKPDDYELLDEYNIGDVEVMRQCYYKMLPLTEREQKIWQVTCDMNQRGIQVDLLAVRRARELVNSEAGALRSEFQDMVGCTPQASVQVAKWCELPDVTSKTVASALQRPLASRIKRALQLRQLLSKSSLAKLDGLLLRTSSDGRLRGSLVYAGAQRTGRWAGRGVQLQNFPRGMGEWSEIAVDCMVAGWPADSWLKLMPEMLRSFFTGPFIVADYAQIEARVLAWLAKELKAIHLFEQWDRGVGLDPYRHMAASIYNIPVAHVTEKPRFVGKQTVLGCGYQMGPDKFMGTMEKFNNPITREFAERVISVYRNKHPNIVQLWWNLNGMAIAAMKGKPNGWFDTVRQGGVFYLRCRLPSGRHLYYPKARLGLDPKFKTERVEYWGQNTYTREWGFVGTYGGKLAENIVQATSRDLLADAMLRMRERDASIPLTVHDEVLVERDNKMSKAQVESCMKEVPAWAKGCPINVEVFECNRYRK